MSRVSLQTLIDRSTKNMGLVHPVVKETILEVIKRAYKEGINVQISSGYRSNAEQQRLYNQGRTTPGKIVTNAKPGQSMHNYGLAVDYFLTNKDGTKALWTVNDKWRRVATIAKSLGFEWGGDWRGFVDYPHLQMTGGLTLAQLQAGRRPNLVSKVGKTVSKPTTSNSKPTAPAKKPVQSKPASTGGSIVDYLKSIGVDSSKENRKKLAKEYGVAGYDFSAEKNLELLNKMKAGKKAEKPATKPKQQAKGTVHLPASAKTWRTYKLNVQPIKKNSDWSLTPSRYGGLTYEILGRPYPNVVTIMTGRGKRNIYVGPETGAVIK